MTHHTITRDTTLVLLLSLPISFSAACVGEIEPTPPGSEGPGGKTDYDGDGEDDGGTSTNPVPPSASATATVDCAGGHASTFSPDWEALSVILRLGATAGGAGSSVADTWTGPLSDDFFLRFDGGGGSPSCGVTSARVVVRTTALANGTGGTYAVIDSLDSEIDWRRCS